MRIISFNCEGIVSAAEKGFFTWAQDQDADVICLQDVRAKESDLNAPCYNPEGYFRYFNEEYIRHAGQGGVALYTRIAPKAMISGLSMHEADIHGLYLQADFDQISIGSLLVPETDNSSESLNWRFKFMEEYLGYLNKQRRKRRDFITCGSWHIAHKKIDVKNWHTNQRHPGFLPAEQRWMDEIIDGMGYVDTYREVDSEGDTYSFWPSERAFAENDGFRFDCQIATSNMKHRVLHSGMYSGRLFSRHAPVIVDYDWELSF